MMNNPKAASGFTLNRTSKIALSVGLMLIALTGVKVYDLSKASIQLLSGNTEKAKRCERNVGLITFKRLSDEKDFPFHAVRFSSPNLQDQSAIGMRQYNLYRAAVTHFPNVKACLIESEKKKQAPNLTRVDWVKIHTSEDVAVCTFRVFSSIGSLDGSKQWLESQGFATSIVYPNSHHKEPAIVGIWNTRECGQRFYIDYALGLPDTLLRNLSWARFRVSGEFTMNGEVTSAGSDFNYE